jgi:peptidoglycan/LPS O-acetylase OafA/YrhL
MLFIAIVGRSQLPPPQDYEFDYRFTATYLKMDGLIVGFYLSYAMIKTPRIFQTFVRAAPVLFVVFILELILLKNIGGKTWYVLWETSLAILCGTAVILAVSRKSIGDGVRRIAGPIALASYSIYLTHPWVLIAALALAQKFPESASLVYFPVSFAGVALVGSTFWFVFERTSIAVRDRYWPRRLSPDADSASGTPAYFAAAPDASSLRERTSAS